MICRKMAASDSKLFLPFWLFNLDSKSQITSKSIFKAINWNDYGHVSNTYIFNKTTAEIRIEKNAIQHKGK